MFVNDTDCTANINVNGILNRRRQLTVADLQIDNWQLNR